MAAHHACFRVAVMDPAPQSQGDRTPGPEGPRVGHHMIDPIRPFMPLGVLLARGCLEDMCESLLPMGSH